MLSAVLNSVTWETLNWIYLSLYSVLHLHADGMTQHRSVQGLFAGTVTIKFWTPIHANAMYILIIRKYEIGPAKHWNIGIYSPVVEVVIHR